MPPAVTVGFFMKGDCCYWCGAPWASNDHVPPVGFFPNNKRDNLQTVGACRKHNENFKLLDERMRFYLQVSSDHPDAVEQFADKSLRSIQKPKAAKLKKKLLQGLSRVSTPAGELAQLRAEGKDYATFLEKVTRGVYRLITGDTALEQHFFHGLWQAFNTNPFVVTHGKPGQRLYELYQNFRISTPIVGNVPYPEIFNYEYMRFDENGRQATVIKLSFYKCTEALCVLMPEKDLPEKPRIVKPW